MIAEIADLNVKANYKFKLRVSVRGGRVMIYPLTGFYQMRVDCWEEYTEIIHSYPLSLPDPYELSF